MSAKYRFILLLVWTVNVCLAQQPDSERLEQANDFVYTLASGGQGTLYVLQSDMLLLYFYNPTCDDCHALMKQLEASEIINRLIDENQLTVLAVYPEDDPETWNEYAGHISQKWINAYDRGTKILSEGIFLIKSFPALYLLDREKRIRMKEMTFTALESELQQIYKQLK